MREFGSLDRAELAEALPFADLRVLLMVLFHVTGDRKWITAPYRPKRDVTLIADRNAGFDAGLQAEIRKAAEAVLSQPADPSAFDDPGDALMGEMMSACLNEAVPPEYAGMMREEVGFVPRFAAWSDADAARRKLAGRRLVVGIVGAGAGGIALAANLERLGIPYAVFEQNGTVGGTWHRHRYPGCGVDTPNHAYSFSFGERYPWSRYFSPRDEVQDYMERIAGETGMRRHVRFHTTVASGRWDEGRNLWRLELATPQGAETAEVGVLVSAIGQFSQPYRMPIRGNETFPGPLFHPIDWPAGLDLAGKRVALIGTGATAMQIVPEIAASVRSLTIYQRSPQWARPIERYHDPIGGAQQWLLRKVPYYAEWFRLTMLWRYGDGLLPTLRRDPDWPDQSRSVNRVNERHRKEMLEHIGRELEERGDLLSKCTPSYPPYGKRILLDAGWYRAVRRPNVELVTEPVDRIDGSALVSADGSRREADIVIVSTGYVTSDLTARLNLTGRHGRTLAEAWGPDNPHAYLGSTVSGFPNLFMIYGPNTDLAHGGSVIFMNECAARYAAGSIAAMVEKGIAAIDLKPEVLAAYTARLDAEHRSLIWTTPGLRSRYRNSLGRVTAINPWRLVDYWSMTHQPDLENYEVKRF